MKSPGAVLVGFQDQGNLGIGYLAANLLRHGFEARVLDFRAGADTILREVQAAQPLLVGFSLIFQYYLPQFAQLASCLRAAGVPGHFSAGGHFPTVRSEEVLRAVPELDSVVRCEGEVTLLELIRCLAEKRDWRRLPGLAYRRNGECVVTPPRPLISDLDELPRPLRCHDQVAVLGRKAAALAASRGCARDCSFCSIHQFYRQAPGRKVRVRQPAQVVEEMRALHHELGTTIFLFQDDDFPITGPSGRRWAEPFLIELRRAGLLGRVIWKISCRSDEVESALFARLRQAGLYMVYLGIESGNAAGLAMLNKRLTPEDNLRAVQTVRDLDLCLGYGFMLFDPSSTFASVYCNLKFLRRITADGRAAAVFCRMLPYAGTAIERMLSQQGRLRGTVENPDYAFLDPRLDAGFEAVHELVGGWIHGAEAVTNLITWGWQEYWVLRRLFPGVDGLPAYERFLCSLTRRCNASLLSAVEKILAVCETGKGTLPNAGRLAKTAHELSERFSTQRDAFVLRNQEKLLAALHRAA